MKKSIVVTAAIIALSSMGSLFAGGPVENIDPHRHGNLAAAQSYIVQAYERINRAQKENHDELGGHAQKAKELLIQADIELRKAANVSNEHGH